MSTIADLRSGINAYLDTMASTLGEETELNQAEMDTISRGVDEINETWNPNLPTRPANP